MPRGRRKDVLGSIRVQAAKVVQQLERQIRSLEAELEQLQEQMSTWRSLVGGGRGRGAQSGATRGLTSRARRAGGKRVDWNEVLGSVPRRFGVQDVMRHPGAAAKGRAQVYPALSRWEKAKLIRRVSQGVYEKTGGAPAEGESAAAKPKAKRRAGGRRAARARRGQKRGGRAKAAEAKG